MMDPRLVSLLGDKRFKCFVNLLKGKGCSMLDVDPERLLAGDRDEIDKVYRFLPEFEGVRRQGYDIVGKLVELANKLQSEKVADMAAAVGVMMSVMFGRQVSEEEAKQLGAVIDAFKCVEVAEDGVSVNSECLDGVEGVPEEFKNQIRTVSLINLIWSA
jgi:hypothetical protein